MKTDWPIGGVGYVLIEVETRYEDKTGFKGLNGKELVTNTQYEPLKYVKTCGKVIQIPYALGERMLRQIPVGLPGYGPIRATKEGDDHPAIYAIGGVYKYKRISDIEPEVRVGDTIWFNRLVLHRNEYLVEEIKTDKGAKFIFKVDYDLIVCIAKREEKGFFGTREVELPEPIMIGGWCFLEPLQWPIQYFKTYYDQVDKEGNPIEKPKDKWMQLTLMPKVENMRGILKHFGKPLKGDNFYYTKDAEVYLRKKIEWRYVYKGKELILLKQWDLVAEVVEEELLDVG